MTVYGNLYQTAGTMRLNGGTLEVGGDYEIRSKNSNGTYSYSEGTLVMDNANDHVVIEGSFAIDSGYQSTLTKGIMEIKGDFSQSVGIWWDAAKKSFSPSGTHTVVLNGNKTQIVRCEDSQSGFNKLSMINDDVVFKGNMGIKGFSAEKDIVFDTSEGNNLTINGTINLNGHNLVVDGELVLREGTIDFGYGNLHVPGNLDSSTNLYFNGGNLTVDGNYTQRADTTIGSNTTSITGNLYQLVGTMRLNGGTLEVGGDYEIRSKNSNGTYSYSEGTLVMDNANDHVVIEGSFAIDSGYQSTLTKGIMEIKGDFSQSVGIWWDAAKKSFNPSGTHTVVLNGSNVQYVNFESSESKFYNLKLTKDFETGYVFTPDNCWTNLYLESNVNGVTISTPKQTVYQDEIIKLSANVTGINNPSQQVNWSVSGNTDSATTISENGILIVGLNEQAPTITITATSKEDDTKSASVDINVLEVERVVEGLFITPSKVSAVCGESCKFFAYVYGIYGPSQEVTWSISGNTSLNTEINNDGMLSIADDETTDKITITATSTVDPTKSASVTVNIFQIKITSTVSNVTVTIATGETQKLQAVVTGSNNPNQKVIWSVGGNESANTFINENGELTVGNDETAKTIIVRATSVEDPEKYGEFAINIATPDEQKYQIGDTNLDGTINIRDVTAIQRYLVELETFNDEQIALADTNGDGEINIADATHLQMYLAEYDGIVLGKA